MIRVPRTVTLEEAAEADSDKGSTQSGLPIESLRNLHAYVLLGDSGIGKSSTFDVEAAAAGTKPIKAHDFITFDQLSDASSGKPLFIDGLDETRAGNKDGRTPLDSIRRQLDRLGRPPFRLSCREIDWLGASDQSALAALMPDGTSLKIARLDKLTAIGVSEILSKNFHIANPHAFIREAERNRLAELLVNPQTLRLLAEAVGNGNDWPTSRQETYELACKKLTAEPNIEHQAALKTTPINIQDLFDAAGYLCAINLISDVYAFSATTANETSALGLDALGNPEKLPLHAALRTRLFQSLGTDRSAPTHRSIAEFLAAKFIAQKIAGLLPVSRSRALICGTDGEVVTALRAFAAWLAVFSPEFRGHQIEHDPIGILTYGDVRSFSGEEKKRILGAIKNQGDSDIGIDWRNWHSQNPAALATPDMFDEFDRILQSVPATKGDQLVADTVVEAMYRGNADPAAGPRLLAVTRDARWWDGIRRIALRTVLDRKLATNENVRRLLSDVNTGVVEDDADELLGALLEDLYPSMIAPEELIEYFHPPKDKTLIGVYSRFWQHRIIEATSSAHLGRILKAFATIAPFKRDKETRDLWRTASELVARALHECGDHVGNDTIFDWLSLCLDDHDSSHIDGDVKTRIYNWFDQRPDRYKGVLSVALNRMKSEDPMWWHPSAHMLGAPAPSDIGAWWLQQAAMALTEERARLYFKNSFFIDQDGHLHRGLTIEMLEEWVRARPAFADELQQQLTCNLDHNEWRVGNIQRDRKYAATKEARAADFRAILDKLRTNTAHSKTMYDLAMAYKKMRLDAHGETPQDRLADFLDDDPELVDAALLALKNTINRDDLPSPSETLDSDRKGKIFHLTPALVVGMELVYRSESGRILQYDDDLLVSALVSRYVFSGDEERGWFDLVLAQKPILVARAQVLYLQARLNSKKDNVEGVYQLAHDPKFADLAKLVVPTVLRSFPHRARIAQLSTLEYLLKAGLRSMAGAELATLIQDRLTLRSLDVAQRIYWLSTGVVLDANIYLEPLAMYVGRSEIRVGHLGAFLYREHGESGIANKFAARTVARFIELIGPSCQPGRRASGFVTADMNRADLVRSWINQLSASPEPDAKAALQLLASKPSLRHWAAQLGQAQADQSVVLRDFGFVHPDHNQVTGTLYKGLPANAADIAAIVNETLTELTKDIGTSDLNLYRQFWNVDFHDRVVDARPEEACRDALTAMLRERLRKYQIECQAETRHVDKKRSDIWCSFGTWGVPVEIKRDSHPEMWRAIGGQLIPKYSIDPRAQGLGIYVVLWFGGGKRMTSPTSGRKPISAAQLLKRLGGQVPHDQTRLISVHVIDVQAFNGRVR